MIDKNVHFISGMPRSGSTLLCNILNQNPRFHATGTSGVLDLLLLVRNNWNLIPSTGNFAAKTRAKIKLLNL